jgi:hypothetical protein
LKLKQYFINNMQHVVLCLSEILSVKYWYTKVMTKYKFNGVSNRTLLRVEKIFNKFMLDSESENQKGR